MSVSARRRMTADEVLDWAMAQPEGMHYELVAGEVVAMAPERALHSRAKVAAFDAPRAAVVQAGLACEAFVDGMAVRVDDATLYEPDVLLRCGAPVADDCLEIVDPVVVVEVLPLPPDTRTPAARSTTVSACRRSGTISSSRPATAS